MNTTRHLAYLFRLVLAWATCISLVLASAQASAATSGPMDQPLSRSAVAALPTGAWVAQDFSHPTSGSVLAAAGGDCAAVAKYSATSILVFDIHRSVWQEFSFGVTQSLNYLKAQGSVVFAYSNNLLFGYSSLTGTQGQASYTGSVLYDSDPPYGETFGLSDNLAFFATATEFFVFDAELGAWQIHPFALPGGYLNAAEAVVRDDYAFIILRYGSSPYRAVNLAYSRHTHTFIEYAEGVTGFSSSDLDHGVARAVTTASNDLRLVGYSALSNSFAVETIPADQWGNSQYGNSGELTNVGETTVFSAVISQPPGHSEAFRTLYAFDTRRGSWRSHNIILGDTLHEGISLRAGGQFAFDGTTFAPDWQHRLRFFDGESGTISQVNTGLYGSVGLRIGGKALVVYDSENAFGLNPLDGSYTSHAIAESTALQAWPAGQDFAGLARRTAGNVLEYFIYNARTGNWTTASVPGQASSTVSEVLGPQLHVLMTDTPERVTLFYSGPRDLVASCSFPAAARSTSKGSARLAMVTSNLSPKTCVFDAYSGDLFEVSYKAETNGVGDWVFCTRDTATATLHGYSSTARKWDDIPISLSPTVCVAKGLVGLVSGSSPTQSYARFYAFNGLSGAWVELIPTGIAKADLTGYGTALVVRSDRVYAFDPDGLGHSIYLPVVKK